MLKADAELELHASGAQASRQVQLHQHQLPQPTHSCVQVVAKNQAAVDDAVAHLKRITIPESWASLPTPTVTPIPKVWAQHRRVESGLSECCWAVHLCVVRGMV